MTTNRMWGIIALGSTFSLVLTACDTGFLAEPDRSFGNARVALDLVIAGSAGGQPQAFDKADGVWVQFRSGDAVRLERVFPVRANGQDIPLAIDVPLKNAAENLLMNIEVRIGPAALFRGTTSLQLKVGALARRQEPVALEAVASALALPDSLPTLTAYGDSVLQRGATVFATLDTVASNQVITWTTLDPAVVALQGAIPVAVADGNARLVGRVGALVDTVRVPVFAQVARIIVLPDSTATAIPLGTTRQYSAQLSDRRGNRIGARPLTWTSSNPSVIVIDGNGLATAQAMGNAIIRVTTGQLVAGHSVQTRALPPIVRTDSASLITVNSARLHANVNPNRVTSDAWFEYSTDSTFATSVNSVQVQLTAGAAAVQVAVPVTNLLPRTRYYARARATSVGGPTIGNRIEFVTPDGPPGGGTTFTQVLTGSASNITFSTATLAGTVTTSSLLLDAWFEWSTDPLFEEPAATSPVSIPPNTAQAHITGDVDGLFPETTYYYRVVGRSSSGSVHLGGVRSFRTVACPAGAGGGVSSMVCSPPAAGRITIPTRWRDPVRRQE
ncbi:MAG: Ig-like domain-containing protein [Longimicrobiales bacterium]